MASMVQPNLFTARNNHNGFEMSSHPENTNPPYIAGLSGSAWSGIPNIWQTPSQRRPNQNLGTLQTAPTVRNDSLTAPKSPHDPPLHGSQEAVNAGEAYPLRNATSFATPAPTSVGRSSHTINSPPRQRGPGALSAPTIPKMPHLGTATLLNGSAPDVDVQAQSTFLSSRPSGGRTQAFDVESVNEFVPASQQHTSRSFPSHPRFGNEWSNSFATRSTDFNVDSQSFIPSTYQANGYLGGDEVGQIEARSYNGNAPTLAEGGQYPTSGQTLGQFFQPSIDSQAHSLATAVTNLQLSNVRRQHPHQNVSENQQLGFIQRYGRQDDSFESEMLPNRSSGHNEVKSRGYSTPQLSHHNTNGFSADKNGSNAGGMVAYTPSYTPPTAPGSRRSNSGSGASTRASSQSVDTRYTSFDAGSNFVPGRQAMFANQQPHASLAYHTHGINPYGAMFVSPPQPSHSQGRSGRSYEGQSQHLHSNEARIQQEKEQNLSPLIKEFRANYKTKRYELKDAYNHIVEFSGDQHGSRFIQAKLETANSEEKEKVFSEIQENALQLMTDIFGNYVIQKMFEHGTQAQKKILASQMRGRVYYLTTQVYGCRVVQKALEHILTDQQASMVRELNGNVLGIVENQNGNHVIQKAIERVPSEHIHFIFDAHIGHVVRLSKHNYGCRVVQRILEYGPASVKRVILGELRDAIPNLIEDQFGNYVMQHIIRNGDLTDRRMVVDLVQRQLLHYSKHKFASNVVEAAIDCAEAQQRNDILRELTSGYDSHGQSQVYGLIRDQYGNYVIQKVLAKLSGAVLNNLIVEIQHHLITLRKISHGKQVSAMEKALAEAIATLEPHDAVRVSALHMTSPDTRQRSPTFLGEFHHERDHPQSSRAIQVRSHTHT